MGGGEEHGLELAGGGIDAVVQQAAVPAGESLEVTGPGLVVAGDGLAGEEHGQHRAHAVDPGGNPGAEEGVLQAGLEPLAQFLQLGIDVGVLVENPQLGQTRGHGHRVARQGTGLVDRAQGGHLLHELAAAGVGPHGHAAADDLAVGDQVGPDAVVALGAAGGQPEAGDDLVKDQQGPEGVAEAPQRLQEAGLGRHHAHIGGHGLDDDRGHLAVVGLQQGADAGGVVISGGQGVGGHLLGHAGGIGRAAGQRAGPGLDQHGIGMAVVAPGEFDDFAAARGPPGQPQGRHDGLGAGVDHPHHLHAGHPADQLGHLHLDFGGRAEAQAVFRGLHHGLLHRRMGVAQNQRAPGADQIDVVMAVHVGDAAALSGLEEPGIGPHGAAGPDRGVDAAGQHLLGRGKEGFRLGHQPRSPFPMASASSLAK